MSDSQLSARVWILVGALALAGAVRLPGQHGVFSTHDHTLSILPPFGELAFEETWADVKMPGGWPTTAASFPAGQPITTDRRNTFVVGTIEVNRTLGGFFSGQPAGTGTGGPSLFPTLGPTATRQVAMLQWNTATTNSNVVQRYFYGITGSVSEPDFSRATNARGISVWLSPNGLSDRIAICGETYDEVLPGSQTFPLGWAAASASHPSGFIAVYDTNGALRWTHHFFDPANGGTADCAITDVSIRVDANGNDVVTYCGISTHGSPAGGELGPWAPFLPVSTCSGGSPAVSPGNWDAFVGRVAFTGTGASFRVFHSVVSGGAGQDGLFGISEIDESRFAVAGSTQTDDSVSTFPFTTQCGLGGPHVVGTVMVFNAAGVGPGGTGNLVLEHSEPLGFAAPGFNTVARDICVGRAVFVPSLTQPSYPGSVNDVLYVVGSTDNDLGSPGVPDPFLSGTAGFFVQPPPGQDQLQGLSDGFLAAMRIDPTPPPPFPAQPALVAWTFSYHGGLGRDGLTGVNGWSEFSEHMSVTGFTDDGLGAVDIDVATYFFNNAVGPVPLPPPAPQPTSQPNSSGQLLQVRRTQFGSTNEDRPAVMGPRSASTHGFTIQQFGLGQESGGGVAVGPDGRVNVVGRTTAPATMPYPVFGSGARGPDIVTDAVRTEVDMVPRAVGVIGTGRTDGTGFQTGGVGPFPPPPGTGFTGGTTPFCALVEFGAQVGVPTPGQLPRMLIDFEGDAVPNSTNAAILVSRPPAQVGAPSVGGLQFNFPPTLPVAFITGAEFWLSPASSTTFTAFGFNQAFRLQLPPLPPGGGPVTAQLVCFVPTPVTGPLAGCSSSWTATAAMWFNW